MTEEESTEHDRQHGYDNVNLLEEIDGAELLDEIEATLCTYVAFPNPFAVVAVVLWIAATHAQVSWAHATRLVLKSPEKQCGKSRLLDLVAGMAHKRIMTINSTVAAIFRSIKEDDPPTLIVDEADAIFNKKNSDVNEDLRGLFNAGFGRNRYALRCSGPAQIPTEFPTFCMVAFAAIGDAIPDTITDRAVVIPMRKRAPGEKVSPFRIRRDEPGLKELAKRLADWTAPYIEILKKVEPDLPIDDRPADVWEPLCAIADLAGGAWPARAREAAEFFSEQAAKSSATDHLKQKFLADLRTVVRELGKPAVSSADIVIRMLNLDESPWRKFDFKMNDLAYRLAPYDVHPGQVRPDGGTTKQVRGYRTAELEDVFARYLKEEADDEADAIVDDNVTDSDIF